MTTGEIPLGCFEHTRYTVKETYKHWGWGGIYQIKLPVQCHERDGLSGIWLRTPHINQITYNVL